MKFKNLFHYLNYKRIEISESACLSVCLSPLSTRDDERFRNDVERN